MEAENEREDGRWAEERESSKFNLLFISTFHVLCLSANLICRQSEVNWRKRSSKRGTLLTFHNFKANRIESQLPNLRTKSCFSLRERELKVKLNRF